MGFPGLYQIDVKVEPALTTTVDESGWTATVTGAVGAAVSPPQLQSLYVDPTQPGGAISSAPASSQPSSAPTGFFAPPTPPAPQTPAGSQ